MSRRDDPDRYDDERRPFVGDEDDVPPDPWEPDDDLTPEERAWRFRSTLSAIERRID